MSTPNKLTLIAAALHGVAPIKGSTWKTLKDQERDVFVAAAEFLTAHTFGQDLNKVDQPKLAAIFEEKKILNANANTIVSVFINVAVAIV